MNLLEVAIRRNRTHEAIIEEILFSATDGARQTKIMYDASLSYDQVKKYIFRLLKSGMLRREDNGKIYHTTDLGVKFRRAYEDFKRIERNYHSTRESLAGILSNAGLRS